MISYKITDSRMNPVQHLQPATAQRMAGGVNTRTPSLSATLLSIKLTRKRKESCIGVSDGANLSMYVNESRSTFLNPKIGTLRENLKVHLQTAAGVSSASPLGMDNQTKKHRYQFSDTIRPKNNLNPLYSRLGQKSLYKTTQPDLPLWRSVGREPGPQK